MSKNQKLIKSSGRAKKVIDIPPNVSVEDAMKLYNRGWGHATTTAIRFLTREIGLFEQDAELKDVFIEYMKEKVSKRNIHLQQPKKVVIPPYKLTKEDLEELERVRKALGELRETVLSKRMII